MSNKCYACGQSKREKPPTLREQWKWADLDEKLIGAFFAFLAIGMGVLLLIGVTAIAIELINTIA